jgi:hypothetical protein
MYQPFDPGVPKIAGLMSGGVESADMSGLPVAPGVSSRAASPKTTSARRLSILGYRVMTNVLLPSRRP